MIFTFSEAALIRKMRLRIPTFDGKTSPLADGGSDAWPRRLCFDAQQSHALLYLQIKEYLPDVRDVRPHVRHRVGKAGEVTLITVRRQIPRRQSSSFLEARSSLSKLAIPRRIAW